MDSQEQPSYRWEMGIEVDRATLPCTVCGARVTELRRGRCWGCYTKWSELRPVGRGAACAICQERRRDHLRLMELHSRSVPLCHVCAARAVNLGPIPETIAELRTKLERDRRRRRQRGEGIDRRIFPRERRVSDRRGPARTGAKAVSLLLPELDDVEMELGLEDIEEIEQTVVREAPSIK